MSNSLNSQGRILIVDDDEAIGRSLSRIMRLRGFEVAVAHSGESAVATAQAFQPHMLVMDIRLPGMDGVAAFEAIRKVLPSIPAVFMTAYASSEKAAAAAELGAISVLSKPLDIASLVVTITQSMGRAPVLIVDDDPVLLISLARALRSADIDVVTVSSMDEAARIVRQRPDRVVVADIFLNDGFGYELIHDMRVANGHRPMLLITGRTDWLRESSDHLPGVPFRCLTKPLDIDLLVGQIRHLQQTKGIV